MTDGWARQSLEGPCVDTESGSGPGVHFVLFGTPAGISTAGSRAYGTGTLQFADASGDGCLLTAGGQVALADYNGDGLQDFTTLAGFHLASDAAIAVLPGTASGPQQHQIHVYVPADPGVKAECCWSRLTAAEAAHM